MERLKFIVDNVLPVKRTIQESVPEFVGYLGAKLVALKHDIFAQYLGGNPRPTLREACAKLDVHRWEDKVTDKRVRRYIQGYIGN